MPFNSSISSNSGVVQNLNGGIFTIGSGNPATTFAGTLSACCPSGNTLFVNVNATGLNNGTSWTDAFTDLQSALGSTCLGITQIWVAKGTYKPSAHPTGCTGCATARDFTFLLKDGISLYGGFASTEPLLSQRNIAIPPSSVATSVRQAALTMYTTWF